MENIHCDTKITGIARINKGIALKHLQVKYAFLLLMCDLTPKINETKLGMLIQYVGWQRWGFIIAYSLVLA